MPCDAVATAQAKLSLSLADIQIYPGALDALAALVTSAVRQQVTVTSGRDRLIIRAGYQSVTVDRDGFVQGQSGRLVGQVRQALESLQEVVIVELTRQRIAAMASITREQMADNGALVLTLEV